MSIKYPNPHTFEKLVSLAAGWYPEEGCVQVLMSADPDSGTEQLECWVSKQEIDAYHPDLYAGLHAIANLQHLSSSSYRADGKIVRNTLKEWVSPLHLTNTDNETFSVAMIERFNANSNGSLALFTVQQFSTEMHRINNKDLPIASFSHRGWIEATPDQVEKHFPGWFMRFLVATELGYKDKELVQAVLVPVQVVHNVDVNDIQFDL